MERDDSIFGTDYSSKGGVTSNGDMELVTGLDNAKQNIRNWLLTDKGFYPSIDSDYGSEIREILGEDYEEESISALKIYVTNALLDNPRVQTIKNITPYITIDNKIKLLIEVMLVNGTSDSLNITVEEEEQ